MTISFCKRTLGAIIFTTLAATVVVQISAELAARQKTPHAIEQALTAGFANARHTELLADIQQDSSPALMRALGLNPRLTSARIRLGLDQERTGDFPAAEATLLEAARFDHRYLPAWTLTNFYYRQNRRSEFWHWAARAATLTYDDFRPLLRLATNLEPDPTVVLDRLGSSPKLERAYLDFLIGSGRLDLTTALAARIGARGDPQDRAQLQDLDVRLQALNSAPSRSR